MIDEKIYTQEDLNNAVANAIKDMSTVLETKDKELGTLRKAYELMADEFITGCRVRCFESHDEDCSERFGCSDWEICGTKENAKAYFIDKAMEELKNET